MNTFLIIVALVFLIVGAERAVVYLHHQYKRKQRGGWSRYRSYPDPRDATGRFKNNMRH
jgi:hypothetical protein